MIFPFSSLMGQGLRSVIDHGAGCRQLTAQRAIAIHTPSPLIPLKDFSVISFQNLTATARCSTLVDCQILGEEHDVGQMQSSHGVGVVAKTSRISLCSVAVINIKAIPKVTQSATTTHWRPHYSTSFSTILNRLTVNLLRSNLI